MARFVILLTLCLLLPGMGYGKSQTSGAEIVHKKSSPSSLIFLDGSGDAIKSISLSPAKHKGKAGVGYRGVVIDSEIEIFKIPVFAPNGRFVALVKWTIERGIPPKGYRGETGSVAGSEVQLFRADGEEMFKKGFPRGRYIRGGYNPRVVVLRTGTAAILTGEGEGPGNEILYVYDKHGNTILTYPNKDTKGSPDSELVMSPAGKYLGMNAYLSGGARTVFFDLATGKSWWADKSYAVMNMDDSGHATLAFQRDPPRKIDLKKLIPSAD